MNWLLIALSGVAGIAAALVLYVLTVAAGDQRPSTLTKLGVVSAYWALAWGVFYGLAWLAWAGISRLV